MNSGPPSMLENLVDRICGLYSLPAVAMEVVRLSRNPKSDARGLAECLSHDPALTARVLQFVNSPSVGLKRRIGTIDEAVAVLGVRSLQSVVLGFSLPPQLLEGIERRVLARYWRHSLAKALAARELANMTHAPDVEEAFVAGLLQHLGMLAMIQELGAPYVDFVKQVWNERGNLLQLEIASLGFDHRALSSRLVERWQFPESLTRVLAHPMSADHIARMEPALRQAAQRLHLAEHIARLLHEHDPMDWELLVDSARRHFSMEVSELEELLKRLDAQLREIAPLFSLEWSEEDSYEALLLESRDLLIRLADSFVLSPQDPTSDEPTVDGRQADSPIATLANAADSRPDHATLVPPNGMSRGDAPSPVLAQAKSSDPRILMSQKAKPASDRTAATVATTAGKGSAFGDAPAPMGIVTLCQRSLARCRQQRWPLTLMMIAIDHPEALRKRHSHQAFERVSQLARKLCEGSIDPGDVLTVVSDGKWGILLEDCDRSAAATVTRELHARLRVWSEQRELKGLFPLTFSMGVACVAIIAKNFEPAELIERADTCLSSAQLSGGDTFKTISV